MPDLKTIRTTPKQDQTAKQLATAGFTPQGPARDTDTRQTALISAQELKDGSKVMANIAPDGSVDGMKPTEFIRQRKPEPRREPILPPGKARTLESRARTVISRLVPS